MWQPPQNGTSRRKSVPKRLRRRLDFSLSETDFIFAASKTVENTLLSLKSPL